MDKKEKLSVKNSKQIKFERWFNTIPGVTANTLIKSPRGDYKEPEIALVYAAYCAGRIDKLNEIVNIIQIDTQGGN